MNARRLAALAACLLITAQWAPLMAVADPRPRSWAPNVHPADFVSGVDNPYFPLPAHRILRYRGVSKDGTETLEIEITGQTKTILGVSTTVVVERHALNGQIVEVSENWFAQHRNGDVWYFGEFSQTFENGNPTGSAGSWEAGVGNALPGIMMKANPQTGDVYFQEFAPGVAQDQAQVKGTNGSTSVLQGSFGGVVETKEWTALEPNSVEKKTYAPGVGLILEEESGSRRLELVEVIG